MKILRNIALSMFTIIALNGCGALNYIEQNYQENMVYANLQKGKAANDRKQALTKLEDDLIYKFEKDRGFEYAMYITNKITHKNNVKYRFERGEYTAFVEKDVISNEIEKANKVFPRENSKEVKVIINK